MQSKTNKIMKKESLAFKIIGRTLAFPFFVCIALIGALIMWLKWVVNFILHGGEAIAYTRENTRNTIQDVYNKMTEK